MSDEDDIHSAQFRFLKERMDAENARQNARLRSIEEKLDKIIEKQESRIWNALLTAGGMIAALGGYIWLKFTGKFPP